MVFVVKNILVILGKNKTILIKSALIIIFRILKNQYLSLNSLTLRRHCNSGPWRSISVDIDKMLFYVAFHQNLHCLESPQ